MAEELISIVVPAYNIGPWLKRCLDSILAQTYQNLEVIVVNDGSTDDTGPVLDACAGEDPRIKAIHKENGGVTSARLRGIREARGEWIGFIDGDDQIEPEMYARLLSNAHTYGADISHCGYRSVYWDGRWKEIHGTGQLRQQDRLTGLRDLLDGGLVEGSLCTKLYRRRLFQGLESWMDPAIRNNEDNLMNYYLFRAAEKAVFEDFCPYHYMLRQNSAACSRLNQHKIFDPIRVRQIILESCEPELKEDARKALMRNLLFMYACITLEPLGSFRAEKKQIRGLIKEQKPWFGLLSLRNRILANMICIAPWSFFGAYRLYEKLCAGDEW